MRRLRVLQVITRWVRGGARQVVRHLLDLLPPAEFEQTLVRGPDGDAEGLVVRTLGREIRPARDLDALARLVMLFQDRRPDLVHAHTYKAGVLASVAGRIAGVPVIFTPHGHVFSRGARIPGVPEGGRLDVLRWVTKAAQACACRVTALSDADLREQLALGLAPAGKYAVVRNGIDVARFAAGGRRLFPGRPVIGCVGRFSSEKGQGLLIEAMGGVLRSLPEARLVLVGYGALESALRLQAAPLGEAVVFAGERDAAEVLSSFDLYVQPSLYESQGLSILEAMAAGVPVVATDVGGVRDAVVPGETGVLAPAGDAAALARAIVSAAQDPARAVRAARASTRVWLEFNADRMAAAYAALYREAVGE
jgi:glycosyltransferase involved in cell wall biosynthesis